MASTPSIIGRILLALLCIAVGFVIGFLIGNTKREVPFSANEVSITSLKEQVRDASPDTLSLMKATLDTLLLQKDKSRFDSLKALGAVRDSLLDVKGRLTTAMIAVVKQPTVYNTLDSARFSVNKLISSCDEIIMDGTLDLLRPTNDSLKALVKDIKKKTEKLQNIAKTVATISDIVTAITTILSSPVLAPISPAAAS